MGLICANGTRTASGPNRMFSGVTTVAGGHRKQFGNTMGVLLNWNAGWHTVSGVTNRGARPLGALHPTAWVPPRKGGGMASRNSANFAVASSGLAYGGVTTTAPTSFTITFADAAGQLISSGEGSALMEFTTNTPLLTASIGGTGSASWAITTNTPILGAEASATGSTTWSITAAADILPLDDSSPLRTAAASFAVTSTLTPYAIGHMAGSTVDATVLNGDIIAAAVWAKAIEAGFTAEQILRILAAHAAGAATGLEGANPQFTGLDGATLRIDGAYAAGTRTIDTLNGS